MYFVHLPINTLLKLTLSLKDFLVIQLKEITIIFFCQSAIDFNWIFLGVYILPGANYKVK
jgi:hypothetical protein